MGHRLGDAPRDQRRVGGDRRLVGLEQVRRPAAVALDDDLAVADDHEGQRHALVGRSGEQRRRPRRRARGVAGTQPPSRSIHLCGVSGVGAMAMRHGLVDGAGPLGQHAVGAADEVGLDGAVEEVEQPGEVPVDVEEHDRLGDQPELVPRQQLERLVERAEAAGQGDEPVGQLGHPGLALVHRVDDLQRGHAEVGDLGPHELVGDHADDLAAVLEGGVGDGTHQPDVAAAVHEPEAAAGDRRAEALGVLEERRRSADVGAAEHADPDGHRAQGRTRPGDSGPGRVPVGNVGP